MTAAGVAFVADMVPGAIARAAGKLGGGFSLDNALRFAAIPPTEWVLLHLRGDPRHARAVRPGARAPGRGGPDPGEARKSVIRELT